MNPKHLRPVFLLAHWIFHVQTTNHLCNVETSRLFCPELIVALNCIENLAASHEECTFQTRHRMRRCLKYKAVKSNLVRNQCCDLAHNSIAPIVLQALSLSFRLSLSFHSDRASGLVPKSDSLSMLRKLRVRLPNRGIFLQPDYDLRSLFSKSSAGPAAGSPSPS